ncbi:MAG: DEAD/DEAH box helicase family protein [Thermoplasmatales archaeon]|nr:DEAD/DEAH box helicase family protein [Thermoplasmatales archaeon]
MRKQIKVKQPGKFRLEDHLLLAKFIANKLGISKLSDIKDFKDVPEEFDAEGRSHMFHAILIRPGTTIPEDKLEQYDDNIRKHFENWKKRRKPNLTLKYFQYLALLFTEIFLDNYFNNPTQLLEQINNWIIEKAEEPGSGITIDYVFGNINKIAYWMATGSGKTMIMNINYWQFMHYNKGPHKINYENIILITPSDEMSNQHLEELKTSGIPAILFQGDTAGYFTTEDKNTIKVLSIHKLKLPEDKKGEGITIDVSSLGTKNLVFVDEGHKGQKTEDMKWKQTRDWLVKDGGFTFEYSATFGQAISSPAEAAFREYSQAILYDYSYKYFYGDGYGKDFRILNVSTKKFADTDVIIIQLANLMSFYEQLLLYEKLQKAITEYNIEKPLWIFVGSKVNEATSDVLQVVKFLNWFLTENENIVKSLMKKILDGNTGILDPEKRDVFAPRYPEKNFPYLRSEKMAPEEIYDDILNKIFHTSSKATIKKLRLINLKKTEGEIGLKAGTSEKYFGVINIGNRAEFIKLVEEKAKEIPVENDVTTQSLFDQINEPNTTLNMLIGAKKFLEGWNSWRVSSMCLLNIGKREGAQIIQLFGRGVRLKGKGYCLKRSRFIEGPHPKYLEPLETLNIYGIKADYMETFREVIEREDVQAYQEIPLKPEPIEPFPSYLKILKPKEEKPFTQEIFILQPEEGIEARIDLLPRGIVIDGREEQTMITTTLMQPKTIDKKLLDLVDWNEILFSILQYKNEKGWYNFIVTKENLKQIIHQQKYQLFCPDTYLSSHGNNFSETYERITNLVTLILKKYFERFYAQKRNEHEKDKYKVDFLRYTDENILKEYRLRIAEDDQKLIEEIKKLIETKEIFTTKGNITLSNAYFQNHLYQPLLIRPNTNKIITIPAGLNEGEAKFVEDLSNYLKSNPNNLKDCEIYLLRNLTRGKGIGFFQTSTFYPDFILWIIKKKQQKIIFIDPKGLTFIRNLEHPKLNLHKHLKTNIQPNLNDPQVTLDAFIISYTPYNKVEQMFRHYHVGRTELETNKHILFQYEREGVPNPTYIEKMFALSQN